MDSRPFDIHPLGEAIKAPGLPSSVPSVVGLELSFFSSSDFISVPSVFSVSNRL